MAAMREWKNGWNWLTGALCLGAAAAGVVWALPTAPVAANPVATGKVVGDSASVAAPKPTLSGDYEIAILIGTYRCGVCRLPELPALVKAKTDSLRAAALARGSRFGLVGVSLDGPRKEALKWIDKFGEFDQVMLGGNWLNDEVVRYVWRESGAPAGVPQLVLVRRRVVAADEWLDVGPDTIVRRWLGLRDLAPAMADSLAR